MTKNWLGKENFPQWKMFSDEIFPHKVYLIFVKVLYIFGPPAKSLPPTSFSVVTPTNVKIRPKIFWLLVSTFLPLLCKISRSYLKPVRNYWTWTNSTPQKNWFCRWNPFKIEVMITSVIKMLVTKFWSHDCICNIIWVTW